MAAPCESACERPAHRSCIALCTVRTYFFFFFFFFFFFRGTSPGGYRSSAEASKPSDASDRTAGTTDLTNGNKAEPGATGTKVGNHGGARLAAVGDRFETSVQKFGDTIEELTGNGGKSSGGSEAGASAGASSGATGGSDGSRCNQPTIGPSATVQAVLPPDRRKYLRPVQTAAPAFTRMVQPPLLVGAQKLNGRQPHQPGTE